MKNKDSYIFTLDRNPNQLTKVLSHRFLEKPNITSHSFRIDYIYQLWKDNKDIKFIQQLIGHPTIYSTSSYVSQMSDQERKKRILSIDSNFGQVRRILSELCAADKSFQINE